MNGILCFVYLIEAIEKFYFLKGALGFHELCHHHCICIVIKKINGKYCYMQWNCGCV